MYKVYGRPFVGSLIAEFLLTESNVEYEFINIDYKTSKQEEFIKKNPMGKVPVLQCPDGHLIFETTAIANHIAETFDNLIPQIKTRERDTYNQYMSIMSTAIYPAYHHHHHSYYYISEGSYDDLKDKATKRLEAIFDHIENILNPYICSVLTAADFYLYMITRWDPNKKKLFALRPNLSKLISIISERESVIKVLASNTDIS